MNKSNHVVPRAFINSEIIAIVLKDGEIVSTEIRTGFNGAHYAMQAFAKFGKCRVMYYRPNDEKEWREVRWRNANTGTMHSRPSFITREAADLPENLQLAAMLL